MQIFLPAPSNTTNISIGQYWKWTHDIPLQDDIIHYAFITDIKWEWTTYKSIRQEIYCRKIVIHDGKVKYKTDESYLYTPEEWAAHPTPQLVTDPKELAMLKLLDV